MNMYKYEIIATDDDMFELYGDKEHCILNHLIEVANIHNIDYSGAISELHLLCIINEYDNINVELLQYDVNGNLEPMDF